MPLTGPDRRVLTLVTALVLASIALFFPHLGGLAHELSSDPWGVAGFAGMVVALQLLSIDLYGRGGESGSAIGILAVGFAFGPVVAMAVAFLAAVVQWVRKRAQVRRGLFDAANFALCSGSAAYLYSAVAHANDSLAARLAGAVLAAVAYRVVNCGLLCLVMSLAEQVPFRTVWVERFRWAILHYMAHAPLAFAVAFAYEKLGLIGLAAFSIPPALAGISVRQYVEHTRASVETVRRANEELRRTNTELVESNLRVRSTNLATIAALSRAIDAKDRYTGGHTERVASVSVAIARALDYAGDELEAIEIGALLHDVGKIGVPERVLNKEGPLTAEEWEIMKEHPVISDYILAGIGFHPFVREVVRWSHERMDGGGYPDGLAAEEIPMPARIVLVADAFDALTTDRSYRKGRDPVAALEELRAHAGTQFCPRAVEALFDVWREEPELLANDPPLEAAA